jgi:carbon-monoxide dehydrogenase medium subunit
LTEFLMKPAAFTYHRPVTLEAALDILSKVAPEGGRILAGGQSLVPMMALRVANPTHLVDINEIAQLNAVRVQGEFCAIGALARHAQFQHAVVAGPLGVLLSQVSAQIAQSPIRERGTFCGSIALADPSSEWCLVTVTLGGFILAKNKFKERKIPAADYFQGLMSTDLQADEMVVEVHLPILKTAEKFGFVEFTRRAGDLAMAMALVVFSLKNGLMENVRIGVGGAEAHPRRMESAEKILTAQPPSDNVFRAAAEAAALALDPLVDTQTNADFRKDLVRMVVRRALEQALQDVPTLALS